MGLGVSLILIAVGAILTWAVDAHVNGLNVNAIGVILMIVGLIGGIFSLAFWSSWWGPGYAGRAVTAGATTERGRREAGRRGRRSHRGAVTATNRSAQIAGSSTALSRSSASPRELTPRRRRVRTRRVRACSY